MSREIKFRVWDTFNERMVYEPLRFYPTGEYDKIEDDKRFDAPFQFYETWNDEEDSINRPCFVMQYTGLKDKNGKEIYEGDLIRFPEPITVIGMKLVYQVKFTNYYFEPFNILLSDNALCEIIGNIYENPELLK